MEKIKVKKGKISLTPDELNEIILMVKKDTKWKAVCSVCGWQSDCSTSLPSSLCDVCAGDCYYTVC